MGARLNEPQGGLGEQPGLKFSLFDSDELPWCSRLDWGWLFIMSAITGFVGAIILGIYVGLWLKSKGRSRAALYAYLVLAVLYTAMWFPIPKLVATGMTAEVFGSLALLVWFGTAYIVRYEVIHYYSEREGGNFPINPFLTGLLSVWYISGLLRADFPLNQSGTTAPGVLKLSV